MFDALIKAVQRGLYRIFGDVLKELSREYMEQAVSDILDKMGKRVPYDQLTPEDAARLKGYLEKVVNAVMRKSFDRTGGDYIGVQATLKWLSKMPIGRHNVSEFLPELFVRNPDGKFDLTVFTFIPTLQDDLYPLDIEIKIMELRNNIENIHPTCQKKGQDCETLYVEETTKKIAEYETLRQESEQKLRDAVNANATALLNIDTLQLADGTVNQIYRIVAKASRVNSELSSPVVSRKSTNESTESSESTQSKKGITQDTKSHSNEKTNLPSPEETTPLELQGTANTLENQDQRNVDEQDPVSPNAQWGNQFGMTQDQLAGRFVARPLGNTDPVNNTEANSPKEDTVLDQLFNTPEKPFEKHSLLDLTFVYHKGLEGILESGVCFFLLRPSLLIGLVSLCKALHDFQARKLYVKCAAQKMTPYKAFLALWMFHHVKCTLWCPITTVRVVLITVLMLDTIDPDFPGTLKIPADVSNRPGILTFFFNVYWLLLLVCMPAILVSSIWLTVCIPFQKKLMKKFYKEVGFPAMVLVVCSIVSCMILFMCAIFDDRQDAGFVYYLFKVAHPTLMNKLLWDFSFWDIWRK